MVKTGCGRSAQIENRFPSEPIGRKVLLVEDNDIKAEIATLVLSEYGLAV